MKRPVAQLRIGTVLGDGSDPPQRYMAAEVLGGAMALPEGRHMLYARSKSNAPDVAERLVREFRDGTAAKDFEAWGREVVTTLELLVYAP